VIDQGKRRKEDMQMLTAVLDAPEDVLRDDEREAFDSMLRAMESGERSVLSRKQWQWVHAIYERLELGAAEPAQNLWSDGEVPRGGTTPLAFEQMPRPLRPPTAKRAGNE
jgi:hypothetical protein